MIQVKSLAKRFEDKEVIKGIDATFETGKTNLVIGRSGAGKSVFVKCMIGLIRPDQGEVLYDGRDLIKMTKPELLRLRREMGMLFQGSALFDSMTVVENVLFPMEMFSSDSYDKSYRRAMELLERVGLAEAAKKYPAEISGGMMKRTAIARALALNPKYLFCDEPNSGLDPKTSTVIDQLIYELTKEYNITTIVNTHDMNSVRAIGDKIIYIHNGLKEWEGSSALLSSPDMPEGVLQFINAGRVEPAHSPSDQHMSLLKKDSLLTHVLLAVGASVLLVVLLIYGLDIYTRHGDTVKVPDLRGKTLAEMQRILDDAGLKYEINDSTFSRTAIPGTVREVIPAPGSEVKLGRILFIAINGFLQCGNGLSFF